MASHKYYLKNMERIKPRRELRYAVVSNPEPTYFYDRGMSDDLESARCLVRTAVSAGVHPGKIWIYDRVLGDVVS